MTVQGHGIGSYFVEMPKFVQDFPIATYRPEYAENEFLHFAFELGVPGVLLLAGIFVRSFLCADGLKLRLIVLPSRLTSESDTVGWYFARKNSGRSPGQGPGGCQNAGPVHIAGLEAAPVIAATA